MSPHQRILSIDIMRGLTLFLMLFVNDLYIAGVPKWLVHTDAMEDAMGLADWVFPGFLFMVGLSIPFAFRKRLEEGAPFSGLIRHILIRTASLLTIGVFMVNVSTYNEDVCALNKYLWCILVYICFFLLWNNYPRHTDKQKVFRILKMIGLLGLITLAALYRSGNSEHIGWLETKWWGILGLIGWGYLVSALSYIFLKDRLISLLLIFLLFVGLNVLSQLDLLEFLNEIKPIFGVIIGGNVPSIVMCGLIFGVLLKQFKDNSNRLLITFILSGILFLGIGFGLRNFFIISKILATPTWAFLCNGISILLFATIYFFLDLKNISWWSRPFLPAGQNSLTTYLAPNVLYYIMWGLGLEILIYKQDEYALIAVLGSLLWAFLMVRFTALLAKVNIKLKL